MPESRRDKKGKIIFYLWADDNGIFCFESIHWVEFTRKQFCFNCVWKLLQPIFSNEVILRATLAGDAVAFWICVRLPAKIHLSIPVFYHRRKRRKWRTWRQVRCYQHVTQDPGCDGPNQEVQDVAGLASRVGGWQCTRAGRTGALDTQLHDRCLSDTRWRRLIARGIVASAGSVAAGLGVLRVCSRNKKRKIHKLVCVAFWDGCCGASFGYASIQSGCGICSRTNREADMNVYSTFIRL